MEVYAILFLVAIAIGYLTVRFARTRSAVRVEKDGKTVSSPVRKQSHRSKQKCSPGFVSSGSRGNPTSTTLRRSALVAAATQKPWGW
jgi:hypothetical protein